MSENEDKIDSSKPRPKSIEEQVYDGEKKSQSETLSPEERQLIINGELDYFWWSTIRGLAVDSYLLVRYKGSYGK